MQPVTSETVDSNRAGVLMPTAPYGETVSEPVIRAGGFDYQILVRSAGAR